MRLSQYVRLPVVCLALLSPLAGTATGQDSKENRVDKLDWLDGSWTKLRIKVSGEVVSPDGKPVLSPRVTATWENRKQDVVIEGNRFHFWVPAGRQRWVNVGIEASNADGSLVARNNLSAFHIRQTAIDGLKLQVQPPERTVDILVTYDGEPVEGATVAANLSTFALPKARTDAKGIATFRVKNSDTMFQLSAWTDDFKVGGFVFHRDPPRDPQADKYEIKLDKCRDQLIRFTDTDNKPVPNFDFDLIIGTGEPNYQFIQNIPDLSLRTDDKGEAVCRWFPDWESHSSYVEFKTKDWVRTHRAAMTDSVLLQELKPSADRKRVVGRVISDAPEINVAGLYVEAWTTDGQEKNKADALFAFTDKDGRFFLDYLEGSKYSIYINDSSFVSKTLDAVPYDPKTQTKTSPVLTAIHGIPFELHVTAGADKKNVSHRFVNLSRQGGISRRWWVTTDENGRATTRILPGAEVEASVYTPFWRESKKVKAKTEGTTKLHVHHDPDKKADK